MDTDKILKHLKHIIKLHDKNLYISFSRKIYEDFVEKYYFCGKIFFYQRNFIYNCKKYNIILKQLR